MRSDRWEPAPRWLELSAAGARTDRCSPAQPGDRAVADVESAHRQSAAADLARDGYATSSNAK